MNKDKKISQEDLKVWKDYTKDPSDVFDKDKNQGGASSKNLRFKFDLHGYSIDDANKKVTEIIEKCYEKGFSEILVVVPSSKTIPSSLNITPYRAFPIGNFIQAFV